MKSTDCSYITRVTLINSFTHVYVQLRSFSFQYINILKCYTLLQFLSMFNFCMFWVYLCPRRYFCPRRLMHYFEATSGSLPLIGLTLNNIWKTWTLSNQGRGKKFKGDKTASCMTAHFKTTNTNMYWAKMLSKFVLPWNDHHKLIIGAFWNTEYQNGILIFGLEKVQY